MKPFARTFDPAKLRQKIKTADNTFESLPDKRPDDWTCCGENGCDGYGHVIDDSGASLCPRQKPHEAPWLASYGQNGVEDNIYVEGAERALERIKSGTQTLCVFCGEVGNGKTTICESLMRELRRLDIQYYSRKWVDIFDMKVGGSDEHHKFNWFMSNLRKYPVIFIDDWMRSDDMSTKDRHDSNLIDRIVHFCYLRKSLIMTTNANHLVDEKERKKGVIYIEDILSQHTKSRMQDLNWGGFVTGTHGSYRRKR